MSLYEYSISRYNAALSNVYGEEFIIKRRGNLYALYNGSKFLSEGDIDHIKKRAYGILKERGDQYELDE